MIVTAEAPEELLVSFRELLARAGDGRPVDTLALRVQAAACADQLQAACDEADRRPRPRCRRRSAQVAAGRSIAAFLDGLGPALDQLDVGDAPGARAEFARNLTRHLESG